MKSAPLIDEAFRIARFVGVGGAATLVHFAVSLGLNHFAGVVPQAANLAGFLSAFVLSFLGHHHFTFKSKRQQSATLPRFFLVAVSGYLASAVLLALLAGTPLAEEIRLVVAALAIPAASYLASRFFVF